MKRIGYHASHEQFSPLRLLDCVKRAEKAGFGLAMCSDHLVPWSERQGHSGFAWSWLGAALEGTGLPFGVVTAPGYRYHPVIMAQAAATLGAMYPERFWVATGSGEAMNEHIMAQHWPAKPERNARLKQSVDIMRALWAGETVNTEGHIRVENARLYTRPEYKIRVFGAAITPATARWMGSWTDGLITATQPDNAHQKVLQAFREGGGEGKPAVLQIKLSWAETYDGALRSAHDQWRTNVFASSVAADLRTPAQFDAVAEFVRPEDVARFIRVSNSLDEHLAWIRGDLEAGFSQVYLHNVGLNQEAFIEAFGGDILPRFDR